MVVLDPAGRVLLFRYDDPLPLGTHWLTPGGGIDAGEAPEDAAVRELREETGWTDVSLGPVLGRSTRPLPARHGLQHETHFAARVSEPARRVDMAGHEVDSIAAWRWFTQAEVAAEPHPIWPAELPSYLSMVIRSESGPAEDPAGASPT